MTGGDEVPLRSLPALKFCIIIKIDLKLKVTEARYQKYNECIDIGIGNRLKNVPLSSSNIFTLHL